MWRFACCYLLLHFNNVEVCLLLQVTTRLCAFHPGRLTSTSGSTLSTTTRRTTTIWVSTSIMIDGSNGALWRLLRSLQTATKLGQGNVFTGVCDSVHRGGVLPQCMLGCHPLPPEQRPPGCRPPGSRHPPGADIPREQTPPRPDTPPEQTPCVPWADPPNQTPPLPTGADASIRSMSGRYASYWKGIPNVIFLWLAPSGWKILYPLLNEWILLTLLSIMQYNAGNIHARDFCAIWAI